MSAFNFQRFEAHGWVVHRKQLHPAEEFRVEVGQECTPATAPDVAVWTRGRVAVIDDITGDQLPDRVPGDSILKRGRTKAGRFTCVALEASEFWCISSLANRKRKPQLDLLDAEPGKRITLAHDAIVCAGRIRLGDRELDAPQALLKGARFDVIERAIGFIVKG